MSDVELFRSAVRAALDKAAAGIASSDRVARDPDYAAGWVDALRAVRDDLTFTDPDPLTVLPEPEPDDQPRRAPGPDPAVERLGWWALAIVGLVLFVVAIVWWR